MQMLKYKKKEENLLSEENESEPVEVVVEEKDTKKLICGGIWDDAEELRKLSDLSHPKVTVDTSGLSARHTELANRLSQKIRDLSTREAEDLLTRLG